MKYVVDTNVLLKDDFKEVIDNHEVIILANVLRELDKLKGSQNGELAYHARQATRWLEENQDKITFDLKDYVWDVNNSFDPSYVDNKILKACIENDYGIITNDLLLKQKSLGYGINVFEKKTERRKSYTGYKEVICTDAEMANLYENPYENTHDLLTNQYLIVKDTDGMIADSLKWDGENLVRLKIPNIKKFKAVNELQLCAMDLLYNKDIPIKIVAGTYGSGKTLLSVKVALHQMLEDNAYGKIMVVRNPHGSGKEIGWLKGTKEDKTEGFFKPIIQHLDGGEQTAFYMEQRGQLSKEIPYYMKGLSIDDTIVICDEAEDLDVKLIKLIGTRIGKKSCVVFAGDYKQAENEYVNNNGLFTAIEKLKGNPLVGIVLLQEDVRSEASKVFADL